MAAMHEWLAVWAGSFWPAMAAHLWPATIFALVVWGASLLLRRAPAQWRYRRG